ncbi:MAG: hypothetical protein E6H84_10810 [Chloroflexi bacterium]|nr:MAG: hypothetical protein E6H84_10810 [Chloroflexota bacterium]
MRIEVVRGDIANHQGPIALGSAVITSAGSLPNRHVVHAAAMGYRAEDEAVTKRPRSRSMIREPGSSSSASSCAPTTTAPSSSARSVRPLRRARRASPRAD